VDRHKGGVDPWEGGGKGGDYHRCNRGRPTKTSRNREETQNRQRHKGDGETRGGKKYHPMQAGGPKSGVDLLHEHNADKPR